MSEGGSMLKLINLLLFITCSSGFVCGQGYAVFCKNEDLHVTLPKDSEVRVIGPTYYGSGLPGPISSLTIKNLSSKGVSQILLVADLFDDESGRISTLPYYAVSDSEPDGAPGPLGKMYVSPATELDDDVASGKTVSMFGYSRVITQKCPDRAEVTRI